MIARPTVAEERWLLLADRYPALRATIEEAGHESLWKTTTWLARCLGFLLGLLGAGMFAGVLVPFSSPWLVGGLIMMVVAEWLVATRRVFHSGVEEALYLCGAVAAVVQILIWNRSSDHEEIGVAMLSGAVLLVGWRLLNPLFTTLAAAGFSLAVSAIGGHLFDSRAHGIEAGIFCAVLAVAALILGGRTWRRPSHDHMLEGLMILMPSLSCLWLQSVVHYSDAFTRRTPWALAVAGAFFVMNMAVGVRRRQHAPLIAALGSLACMIHALDRLLSWSLHWKMIACGAALMLTALLLDRWLKQARNGVTSRPAAEPASWGLLEIAAAAHLAPAAGNPPPESVHGQGGSFGGGGASGRF
jgi:hypothetical protein